MSEYAMQRAAGIESFQANDIFSVRLSYLIILMSSLVYLGDAFQQLLYNGSMLQAQMTTDTSNFPSCILQQVSMGCSLALKTRLSAQVYVDFSHSIKHQCYVFIYFTSRHTICRSYLLVSWLVG